MPPFRKISNSKISDGKNEGSKIPPEYVCRLILFEALYYQGVKIIDSLQFNLKTIFTIIVNGQI